MEVHKFIKIKIRKVASGHRAVHELDFDAIVTEINLGYYCLTQRGKKKIYSLN